MALAADMRIAMRRRLTGLATGLALGLGLAGGAHAEPLTTAAPDDITLGSPTAPVTVIEYVSVSSRHAAQFNNEVFPAFKARYIDTGKVRFVFREFETSPQNLAAAGLMIARCAGPDHYFQVIDAIFHQQEAMLLTGEVRPGLLKIAESAGLTEAQFNACVSDKQAYAALDHRVATYLSRDLINGTPTFVINGKVYDGTQTLAALDAAVAEAQGSKQ